LVEVEVNRPNLLLFRIVSPHLFNSDWLQQFQAKPAVQTLKEKVGLDDAFLANLVFRAVTSNE